MLQKKLAPNFDFEKIVPKLPSSKIFFVRKNLMSENLKKGKFLVFFWKKKEKEFYCRLT